MKELAPVAVFVYNRPDHAKQMLAALDDNLLAEQTDLFIFSDGAKNEKAVPGVKAVRALIHDYKDRSKFRKVTIHEAERNIGCRDSIISGVSEVIRQYGRVIIVEDDLICRRDFLKYMNEGLDLFENDPRIWSLTGHTRDIPQLKDYPYDFYLARRAGSWGWAIWKDRWDRIDWAVSDYEKFRRSPYQRWRFGRGGGDLIKMLENEMNGKSDAWDLRLQYTMAKLGMLTVYPKKSFVFNIGLDGSGTHCVDSENDAVGSLQAQDYDLRADLRVDERLHRGFCRAYYPSLYERGVRRLKRILKK